MNTMQHQYWVTKKSVLRKLGGKEDECIVSSDAELDAKLELFRSISDTCVQLQRVIDLYQERLCYLAQEENALGRYLKECGKNEKNSNAGHILSTAGKSLAYIGHQRLTIRPPLVRLHHEVETFRGRAVSDTRGTVVEMEKYRTEYRAALSWMKSASSQLDPDTGHGLEQFRKAQSYVRSTKTRFDRYMLACLQKVDLLAAARCNMFSHALVSYQNAISIFSTKASEALSTAADKVTDIKPYEFYTVPELSSNQIDKDKHTFFNAEYTDTKDSKPEKEETESPKEDSSETTNLLGEDFSTPTNNETPKTPLNGTLLDLSWPSTSDFLGGDFMPSKLLQEGMNFNLDELDKMTESKKPTTDQKAQMSWLSLFAELDPLANQESNTPGSGDRA
ncbi:islet cell autoantigen 1 [Onthophagus taurus]|uniref:islet cell autoantigen 1 n=1 Tax=Onthophagus taurus TaxID=166361 RepID=UPI000C2004DD|nr:islet cell autoantigen 1 [Onthophagus taurus]